MMIWCETYKSSYGIKRTGRQGTKNEKFASGVHTNLIKVINLISEIYAPDITHTEAGTGR